MVNGCQWFDLDVCSVKNRDSGLCALYIYYYILHLHHHNRTEEDFRTETLDSVLYIYIIIYTPMVRKMFCWVKRLWEMLLPFVGDPPPFVFRCWTSKHALPRFADPSRDPKHLRMSHVSVCQVAGKKWVQEALPEVRLRTQMLFVQKCLPKRIEQGRVA